MKKFKTIKDYLETCSEDEKDYIYQIYFDMSLDELVDIIFSNLAPDDVIEEIEEYREEVAEDEEQAIEEENDRKSNYEK
jgi:predicted DNA-binding ArsR family transcriptional regulator